MKVCLYGNKYVSFPPPSAHSECRNVPFPPCQDAAPCTAVDWNLASRDVVSGKAVLSVVWTVLVVCGCYGQRWRPRLAVKCWFPQVTRKASSAH